MKKVVILRQGDVLLRRTSTQPTDQATVVTDQGRTILAYGEVTGHAHQVVSATPAIDNTDPVPAQQLFQEPDGSRILVVRQPAALVHEEHARIHLAPGQYEVIRQVEYTPAAIRTVAD